MLLNAFVDGDRICLVARMSGKRVVRSAPAEWVVFLRASQVSANIENGLRSSTAVRSIRKEGEWMRVGFLGPESRRIATEREGFFAHHNLEHFEGDVDPVRRYLTDTDTPIAKPNRCFFDLETDSRVPFSKKEQARILSWTVTDEVRGFVASAVLTEDTDRAEADLVSALWKALEAYDQVLAWNGDGFDFPVLGARTDHLRVKADPRLWLWLDHLLLFKKMNSNSAESGEEKRSMKLEAIAQAVLGEGKDSFDARKTWEAWAEGGESRARLLKYNEKDTLLLAKIEKKKGYAALFDALAVACSVFPNTSGLAPTRQVDGFMLKLGMRQKVHFPSRVYREGAGEKQFKGAQVVKPKIKGIGRNVHVCDFSRMYPSIIVTFNMSPETLTNAPVNGPIPPNTCRCPTTGETFRTDTTGLLVQAVLELIRLRKYWNDLKASLQPGTAEWHDADNLSTAYKVAVNAFYGVMGNAFSRYFDWRIAESVTQTGVWLIKLTISAIEDRGWQVVYSDTDSSFVQGCTRQEFEAFVAWCNKELYPPLIAKQGCITNDIVIAYEKEFDRIIFSSAKRYVATFAHYKGKAPKPLPELDEKFDPSRHSHPEVKGLEYKRGDATMLAAKLQERVIHMLMLGEERIGEYEDLAEQTLKHVLHDPLPFEEVVQSAGLSKSLKEYKPKAKKDGSEGNDIIHVSIGKELAKRGYQMGEGQRVEWVVMDSTTTPMTAIPAEDYTGECDRFYVWENRVWKPTQRLLEAAFPDHLWRRLERIRPPKGRHKPPPKEQAGFDFPISPPSARIPPRMSPRARDMQIDLHVELPTSEPWELHLSETDDFAVLKGVLLRFPGPRAMKVVVHLPHGRALLESKLTVDGSPALEKAIELAREEAWFAVMTYCG